MTEPTSPLTPAPKGRGRRRYRLPVAIGVALLACVGWSIFWKVAANSTEAGLDDWLAGERVAGRVWTCKDRTVSGYPFRIEVRCREPSFSGRVAGRPTIGQVGDIVAAAHVYRPSLIFGEIASPLTLRSQSDDLAVVVQWKAFRVRYWVGDDQLDVASLIIEELRARAVGGVAGDFPVSASAIEAHLRQNPARTRDASLFDLTLRVAGAEAPAADRVTGETGAMNIALAATLSQADYLSGAPAVALERWRRARGELRVSDLKVAKGGANVAASGVVDLDDAHRLDGKIDVEAAGVESLFERFGIPAATLAIGNLLGGIFSDAAPKASGATRVSVTLKRGGVSVGPVRLPYMLQPLY